MKKIFFAASAILLSTIASKAQYSSVYIEDLMRYSNYGVSGSAKVQGMGGSFSALGGDMSSAIYNPAGFAFYNRNEFSFSPVFTNQSSHSNYITNNNIAASSSNMNLGQIGAVFSNPGVGSRKKRTAWAVTYNKLANFNNFYKYSGVNDRSSMTDYFAADANKYGVTGTYYSDTQEATTAEQLYYQTYMIDSTSATKGKWVSFEPSVPINQSGKVTESGSLGQFNISFASNFDDKTYIGGGIGIQNLNYRRINEFTEVFPNAVNINQFTLTDQLSVKGSGVNFNLGGIFKVAENLQIGASMQSPTWLKMNETYLSSINVNLTFKPKDFAPLVSTIPNDYGYKMVSPLRSNLALAYFLPQKIGVINLEANYVGYSMMNVKDPSDAAWSALQKQGVHDAYKDVVNLKIGTELKYKMARLRFGYNFMPNPNKIISNPAKNIFSFGAGIRSTKYFADVAYSFYPKTTSYFTPYTTNNANDYASVLYSQKSGQLAFSFGTYF